MSFILDALKKLDKKHPRGSVPDLQTVHKPMPEGPKKRSALWPYLILFALLLNAGLLLVWLLPWQLISPNAVTESVKIDQHQSKLIKPDQEMSEARLPVPAQPSVVAKPASPEAITTQKKPLSEEDKPAIKSPLEQINVSLQKQPAQAENDLNIELQDKPIPMIDIKEEPEIFQTTKEQEPIIRNSLTGSQTQAETGDASKQKVLNNNELPLSVQHDLPKMTISGHIYSNEPGFRIVNINGQILREGEVISEGLKLEEITSTGIILSYKGYRFHMRLF